MHKEPQLSTLDELRGQLLLGWQRDAILPCRAEGSTAGLPAVQLARNGGTAQQGMIYRHWQLHNRSLGPSQQENPALVQHPYRLRQAQQCPPPPEGKDLQVLPHSILPPHPQAAQSCGQTQHLRPPSQKTHTRTVCWQDLLAYRVLTSKSKVLPQSTCRPSRSKNTDFRGRMAGLRPCSDLNLSESQFSVKQGY